ncbi:hypothetical protein AWH56_020610 [Anaerobacillus isosaccharinicus]|uniref:Uncharacterized protein n=1 Tax=Anaerobacillus isosaccharinicus TaxID=1532552 RepID=A0A1S2MDM1_9BACI|nr:hypothetical protein [Anaerobacillus isosaccharinicus]MBA5586691.1 hypothetical protein [Anaerobacillus isosaccharinicus]QOY35080.1 hypothetical protein AWH56_020610 [Anaerobacillus isosaccharinicus]
MIYSFSYLLKIVTLRKKKRRLKYSSVAFGHIYFSMVTFQELKNIKVKDLETVNTISKSSFN